MSEPLSIAAGQTGIAQGDLRGQVTLALGATLDVASGTSASLFGGLLATTAATLAVEAGATIFVASPVSAAVTFSLRGSGSLFEIAASTLPTFAAAIGGLIPGSMIDISGARITSVARRGLVNGRYGLILLTEDGVLGTISIATGLPALILAVPDGVDGSRLLTGSVLPTPTTLQANFASHPDQFVWAGGTPGTWSTAAEWRNSSGTISRVPGAGDAVFLNSGTTRILPVAGAGAAATIATSGAIALAGEISAGLLLVGTSRSDALVATANAVVTAGVATLRQGVLSVQGGTVAVAGTLTLGGLLDEVAGGRVTAGSLLMNSGAVRLSATSSMYVGTVPAWMPGTLTIAADGFVKGSGTITAGVTLSGKLEVNGAMSLFGALTGSGTIHLDVGSTLFVTGGIDQATVEFTSDSTLELFGGLSGTLLSGFGEGDALELAGNLPGALTWAPSLSGGRLNLGSLGTMEVALASSFDPARVTFAEAPDGLGGTTISAIPCFLASTLLQTPHGRVSAGEVRPGNWLTTASGAARRTVWIGRTMVFEWRRGREPQLDPVRIRAHALGPGCPRTDMMLSPLHGVVVDTCTGVRVVPAIALCDGKKIDRDRANERLEYIHIAFDRHDAILAEGLACESFLPHGPDPRGQFCHSAGLPPACRRPLAPRLEQGYLLSWLRRALRLGPTRSATGSLRGTLDSTHNRLFEGWACGADEFHLLVEGAVAGRVICNRWRSDLELAEVQGGYAGFEKKILSARTGDHIALAPA